MDDKSDEEMAPAKVMRGDGRLLGSLDGDFPFGVLLIADEVASDEIPFWANSFEQATASLSAIAVKVLHGQEGPVSVRLWSDAGCDLDVSVFDGHIYVASGVLSVSDALSENALKIPLVVGKHRVEIFANSPVEASRICLVLDRTVQ